MTWVKFDDRCTEHPKIAALSPPALALWFSGNCYCNRNLTDGFIPDGVARRLIEDAGPAIGEAVERGVWHRTRGGYQVHDYLDYQPSKEQVLAERDARTQRVARWRERKRGSNTAGNAHVTPLHDSGPSYDSAQADALRPCNTVTNTVTNTAPVPVPVKNPNPLKPLSSSRSDLDRVWAAYVDHHPQAKLTKARRGLIERRLRDHDADTLIAAVAGNHRSPFHCGENEGGKLYHDLGLILRDADKVEAFAALAAEQPTDRLARKGKLSPRELAALADELDGGDPFGFIQIEAAS